jgi:hypothetical protein
MNSKADFMNEGIKLEVLKSPNAKKRYDLMEGDMLIASLNYPKRFTKSASVEIGNKRWLISRSGFWKHHYEIISEQSPYSKWKLDKNWRGLVSLRMEDNRQFNLRKKGFWKTTWIWVNENEEPVIELQSCGWPQKKRGIITVFSRPDEATIWLCTIGWFMLLCAEEDAAAVATPGA